MAGDRASATSPAGQLLKHRIKPERILDRWDDLLRVAATIRHGHAPASLLVARLQASARQNQLTQAMQEYGRIIKTISILRYLHNKEHRRRIHAQLNNGESLHALRRHLFFANLGRLQRRRPDDQDLQAQCLTLLTNAIVCWNTVYLEAVIDHLRSNGSRLDDDTTRQLSPTTHEHINVYGRYDFTGPTAPSIPWHPDRRVSFRFYLHPNSSDYDRGIRPTMRVSTGSASIGMVK